MPPPRRSDPYLFQCPTRSFARGELRESLIEAYARKDYCLRVLVMSPALHDNDEERIARLELLLEQLQRQNDELKERVQSELNRIRVERHVLLIHASKS